MNYFKANKIQPITSKTMMQGPSSEDFLSQSIVHIVNNPGNSSVFVKNQNNNSIPNIQTGMLDSFNRAAFETFRKRQMQQTIVSPSFQHENKPGRVNVNFSHGNNFQQNFNRFAPPSTNINNFHSIYPNRQIQQQQPSHFGATNNRSHSVSVIRPYSSIASIPHTANLNHMAGQLNKPFQMVIVSQPFTKLQSGKQSPLKRIKHSQKKLNPFESINQNSVNQQIRLNLFPVVNNNNNNRQRDQNETSFQVVQSPAKNISSISIERSQYVLMPENKVSKKELIEQKIDNTSPKQKTAQKRIHQSNLISLGNNTSMIFSIQQQPQSSARNPLLTTNKSLEQLTSNNKQTPPRSSLKIDNRAYLQQQKQLPQSSMTTMIQKLYSKQSRLSSFDQQIGKMSKLSKMMMEKKNYGTQIKHQEQQQHQQRSIEMKKRQPVISSFEKQQQQQQQYKQQQIIVNLQQKHHQQQTSLHQRITTLQIALKNKQQQNTTLKSKLQNYQLSKTIQSQYQKLQIASKLNQVEIKKLRNEIMMFKIKQRLYKNRQKEQIGMINSLKEELKVVKASLKLRENNNSSSLVFAKSKISQY